MKKLRIGQGFMVFILFFGIALLDALHDFDWLRMSFWMAMGLVFVFADNMKKTERK